LNVNSILPPKPIPPSFLKELFPKLISGPIVNEFCEKEIIEENKKN